MVDAGMGALATGCNAMRRNSGMVGVNAHRLNANCLGRNTNGVTDRIMLLAMRGAMILRSRLTPVPRK
jgi:hypothetical protein